MRKPSFFTYFILFTQFITSIATAAGQMLKITGTVIAEYSDVPIANVEITIQGSDRGTVSDELGRFSLTVDSLPVELNLRHIAYESVDLIATKNRLGTIRLRPRVLSGEEVLVVATKAVPGKTPVAFHDLERPQIEQAYFHQDVPLLLADLPGVYAYSDAGNGVGYSYLSIRGFRQNQLGVFFNGIPLNDPEEHSVYWVDHGDLMASSSSVQVQRGVGNSLYGTSVFGGTVNVVTNPAQLPQGMMLNLGYGNYFEQGLNLPSQKIALSLNRRIHPEWSLFLRLSQLASDGYRVNSGTGQQSAHFSLERNRPDSYTRCEGLIGWERTYFAWEGIAPAYGFDLKDRKQRRYNFYADPEYNGGLTTANKDIFAQKMISLRHGRLLDDFLLDLTAYGVWGRGYYEQFKGDREVEEYNLTTLLPDTVREVDLIRQKWLDNGYGGLVYQITFPWEKIKVRVGGDWRYYTGSHFGKVDRILNTSALGGELQLPADWRYYQTDREKWSAAFYIHTYTELSSKLGLMFDLRYLGHRYSYRQRKIGVYQNGYTFNLKYDFFNPHCGLNYRLNDEWLLFTNISTAHREPTDDDLYKQDDPDDVPKLTNLDAKYAHPLIKPEFLTDYELGIKWQRSMGWLQLNLYRMDFKDELIPVEYRYYDADQVLHANIPRTIHQGVELAFSRKWQRIEWTSNLCYADNHFVEFLGDSIGWSGWGGIADYSGKKIPAYPDWQFKNLLTYKRGNFECWWQTIYTGKQYIDFNNTASAAIKPWMVTNIGWSYRFRPARRLEAELTFRINNLFDCLYETFGYNYYEEWDGLLQRVDLYWPAATRNYYLTLSIRF